MRADGAPSTIDFNRCFGSVRGRLCAILRIVTDSDGPSAPREANATDAVRGFKALGDPARLHILQLIADGGDDGVCVCELVPHLGLSQPTVSHHLGVLAGAGLVTREKRGTWAYYRSNKPALAALLAQVPA